MSNPKNGTIQTSVRLPADVAKAFRAACIKQNTSVQAVFTQAALDCIKAANINIEEFRDA